MWVYNSIFIGIVLFCFYSPKNNKVKIIYYSFIFLFFILSSIRWERGTDWNMYYNYFNLGNLNKMQEISEQGFRYINFIVYKLTQSYTVLLFILSSFLYLEYFTIYKYSRYPLLSLLLLFCLNLGNIFFVRQTIAIAIAIYSINFILDKKYKKFILIILIATLFHRTAIVFLLSYLIINNMNIKKKNLIIIFSGLILVFLLKNILVNTFVEVLPSKYSEKLLFYLSEKENTFGLSGFIVSKTKKIINLLQKGIWISLLLYKFKNMRMEIQKISKIYILGVIIYFYLESLGPAMQRIAMYFEVVQIIIFPEILIKLKEKNLKILFLLGLILYCYIRLRLTLLGYQELFIPYKTIFSN